jgi:diguanylate cyclase (GGDEF)-like protein
MSPSGRATSLSAARRRSPRRERPAVELYGIATDGRKAKLINTSEVPLTRPGLDLAGRVRVFQRALRSRVERPEAFFDIVRAVNTTLEPVKIAELVLDRAVTWLPAPCWVVAVGDLAGQLTVLANRGLEPDLAAAVPGVAGRVMQRCQDFVAADLGADARMPDGLVGTVIAFPLSCRGRCVGVLMALDRVPSSRVPRLNLVIHRAIRVLLEPVSVALDNALLLKRAEALSVTDDLTQLYNTRYLNQVLHRETKRASRSGRPLSLLFIDLDGFKGINDNHGHLFGSRALVEAASVIRGSARETDVVARFGGDEFAVILPDTGSEGAYAVGERIRERIAEFQFLAEKGLNLRLTASVGVATLPDAADSADELIHAADVAMYSVKDQGKNGIQSAIAPADK